MGDELNKPLLIQNNCVLLRLHFVGKDDFIVTHEEPKGMATQRRSRCTENRQIERYR